MDDMEKGEKERDKEKNLGAKKPKLALVSLLSHFVAVFVWRDSSPACLLFVSPPLHTLFLCLG